MQNLNRRKEIERQEETHDRRSHSLHTGTLLSRGSHSTAARLHPVQWSGVLSAVGDAPGCRAGPAPLGSAELSPVGARLGFC